MDAARWCAVQCRMKRRGRTKKPGAEMAIFSLDGATRSSFIFSFSFFFSCKRARLRHDDDDDSIFFLSLSLAGSLCVNLKSDFTFQFGFRLSLLSSTRLLARQFLFFFFFFHHGQGCCNLATRQCVFTAATAYSALIWARE